MEAKGPKGQARERGRRARPARPGGEPAGVSLPGQWWSILQRVGVGRPCSAVTSGAARRWPRSLELTNLPCPGLAEASGARGGVRSHAHRAAHARPAAEPPPCALPLCVAQVFLRLPPGVSVPSRQWTFPRPSGRPLGSASHFPPGGAR